MGAVPGGCLLSEPVAGGHASGREIPDWFDVEPLRDAGRRVVVRGVDRPVLVLGSTQRSTVVDERRATQRSACVVRRRSGGGAVLLEPGAQVWADLWVPRTDPLWTDEPRHAAVIAGRWWAAALGRVVSGLKVHDEGSVPSVGSDLVCFAGVGPGEVLAGGRKLVGLAQWRSRQGTLVQGCAYRRWAPNGLLDLLSIDEEEGAALGAALAGAAVGLGELGAGQWTAEDLLDVLPGGPPWDVVRT